MKDALILLNLILSLGIFYSCICRLKMTHRDIKLSVRNRYAAVGAGCLFSAFGHWIFPFQNGEYVGVVIFVFAIAIAFFLDKRDWKFGVPPSASKFGDLYEPGRVVQHK